MLGMGPLGAAPIGAAPYRSPFNYTVPASETKEGQERLRAYYEALRAICPNVRGSRKAHRAVTVHLPWVRQVPGGSLAVRLSGHTRRFL
jgi:hypothetical protein